MIDKVIELITGKDDLERIACTGNLKKFTNYLQKRTIWIPQLPVRFLDPDSLTQQQLLEAIQKDCEELASATQFTPWVLERDGKKRLLVFSNKKRLGKFAGVISKEMNKVFGLQCVEILLMDVLRHNDVDDIDLNWGSPNGMRIKVK